MSETGIDHPDWEQFQGLPIHKNYDFRKKLTHQHGDGFTVVTIGWIPYQSGTSIGSDVELSPSITLLYLVSLLIQLF